MTQDKFVSFAQNGEDVVLWRALQSVESGRYVDVGANHPSVDSVTRAFYDRGWSGLLVEPNEDFATLLRGDRPRDVVAQVVASAHEGEVVLHTVAGTGLSSIVDMIGERHGLAGMAVIDVVVESVPLSELLHRNGFDDGPIHFMTIDTEGAELSVLQSLDLRRHRPWVLAIESTSPTTTIQVHEEWEALVLDAGYSFCLFDGLSRFYVAEEHADELSALLSYPAGVFDDFETSEARSRRLEAEDVRRQLAQLETANTSLRAEVGVLDYTAKRLQRELDEERAWREQLSGDAAAIRETVSWRVTAPLRSVRRLIPPSSKRSEGN